MASFCAADFNGWTHGVVMRTLSAEFYLMDQRILLLLHLDHMYYDHHIQVEKR
jgi:hypothetical protein